MDFGLPLLVQHRLDLFKLFSGPPQAVLMGCMFWEDLFSPQGSEASITNWWQQFLCARDGAGWLAILDALQRLLNPPSSLGVAASVLRSLGVLLKNQGQRELPQRE